MFCYWMKQSWDQEETSIVSDMQVTPHLGQKARRMKEPLDESERGE